MSLMVCGFDRSRVDPLTRSTLFVLYPSMAPAAYDSDSDSDTSNTVLQRKSKSQAESPERQSDQGGPEESEEEDSEIYEIEKILDAKRGATGSVRFLKHSLEDAHLITPFKDKYRLLRQVEGI